MHIDLYLVHSPEKCTAGKSFSWGVMVEESSKSEHLYYNHLKLLSHQFIPRRDQTRFATEVPYQASRNTAFTLC